MFLYCFRVAIFLFLSAFSLQAQQEKRSSFFSNMYKIISYGLLESCYDVFFSGRSSSYSQNRRFNSSVGLRKTRKTGPLDSETASSGFLSIFKTQLPVIPSLQEQQMQALSGSDIHFMYGVCNSLIQSPYSSARTDEKFKHVTDAFLTFCKTHDDFLQTCSKSYNDFLAACFGREKTSYPKLQKLEKCDLHEKWTDENRDRFHSFLNQLKDGMAFVNGQRFGQVFQEANYPLLFKPDASEESFVLNRDFYDMLDSMIEEKKQRIEKQRILEASLLK